MSKYKDTCRDDYMAGGYQQCGESSTDSLDKIAAQDEETSTGTGSSLSWKDCHSLNQLASSATWLKQQLAETCSTGEEGGHESKPRYAVVFLHNLLRYRSWDWRADGSANSKSGLFQLWDALEGSCVVLVVTAHEDEESEKMDKDAAGGAARAGINGGELQDTNLGGGTESDINQDRQDDLQKQIVEDEAALLPFNTWGNQIRLARTGRIALGEWVRLDIALEDVVKEQRPCTMRWQNYFAATEGPGHINSTSKITEIPLVGCEWSGRTAVTTAHPYIVKTKSRTTTTFSGGSTPPGVAEEINAPGGGPGQGGGTHPLPDYTNVDLFFDQFPASDKNSTGQAGSGRINERTSEQELGRSSATTNGTTEDTNEDDADDSESCLGALTWKAMGIVIGSSVLALVTILLCVWAFCCLGSEDVEGEGEQEGPNKAGKRYGNRAKKKLEKSKSKGGTGPLEQDGLGAEDLMNQNAEHSTLNTMVGSSYPSMQPDMFFAGFTPAPPMPGTLALARAGALPNKVGDEVETKPANKVPLAATPMAAPQPPGAAALEQRRARLAGVVAKLKPEPSSGDATLFEGVEDET
ncbi:unnamed protein product [Amoebophrya sp. A120]|nr:unnamed protein product [Amoebophrya sp. A120]|eukprot:GSA120T00005965001.1